MGSIGEILKNKRESLGLTLSEVEDETKIRAKYLQALEAEEFGVIPGRVYVKGFLRTYATFLGLDAAPLVEEYNKLTSSNVIKTEETVPRRTSKSRPKRSFTFNWNPRWNKYLAIIAVILILFLVNKYYPWAAPDNSAQNDSKPPTQQEDSESKNNKEKEAKEKEAEEKEAEEKEAEKESQPTKPEQKEIFDGANVSLQVADGASWMKITVDGKTAFEGTLRSGESKDFKGKEKVAVRLGNAGVVKVTFNGEDLGTLGKKGEVVTQEFTAEE